MIHSFRNLDLNSLNITINNNRLENLTHAKYLGVILDPHLKYKYHIEYIAKKISKSIGILFKLKKLKTPSSILKQIYYSLIYSLLNYNICSYAGTYDVHLNRLFLLQKRAVRLICNINFHSHQLLSKWKKLHPVPKKPLTGSSASGSGGSRSVSQIDLQRPDQDSRQATLNHRLKMALKRLKTLH